MSAAPRAPLTRRVTLAAAAAFVLVPFGVPHVLAGDDPGTSRTAAGVRLCRAHGGDADGGACTVRYGARTYVMDAVTARGWDLDTAAFQRRGCRAAQAAAPRPRAFVFHPDTGVCEVRAGRSTP